jgi:N utilization substance protein A
VVDNDQKHLALGKAGHNVRLASKLCGFDIDIKTEDQYRDFLSSSESRAIVEQLFSRVNEDETPLSELPGLETRTIKLLENGGIFSVEDLVEKSLEELMAIDGIGEKTAKKILEIIEESVDFDETEEEGKEEIKEDTKEDTKDEAKEDSGTEKISDEGTVDTGKTTETDGQDETKQEEK